MVYLLTTSQVGQMIRTVYHKSVKISLEKFSSFTRKSLTLILSKSPLMVTLDLLTMIPGRMLILAEDGMINIQNRVQLIIMQRSRISALLMLLQIGTAVIPATMDTHLKPFFTKSDMH